MKLLPAVAVLTLSIAAMTSSFQARPAQAETCTDPDNVTYVQGSDHCLAIQTYWAGGNPDTLAVYIHGDVPSGRPVDFVFGIARAVAIRGANAVVLIRPGFRGAGRKSSGLPTHSQYAFERYTLPEIESMGAALARLKARHRAKRLVLMGSSGGALISGVLLGRRADIVDAVLLISCPCNFPQLLHEQGWNAPFAASPHKWLDKAHAEARIIAISGSADRITPPHLVNDYVEAAKAKGLDAEFLLVPGGSHGGRAFGPIIGFAFDTLFPRPQR